MNQISPWLTGGATITAVQLEPLVRWSLTGFHAAMPDTVPGVVAALLFAGAHALLNLLASKTSKTSQ
ncbi:hypothetical protein F0160_22765 [Paraburkholderia sp. JPY303]|uniref:hypothetical protein n=1 Tax=Paraburkholderia atlantica TaxID=2654982 RepID=UPI0015908D30|nr:hypothetical protein [Paraburkholderia atlantica]NUY33311.1 hypothetical protein [Paraburkholderia atlantica]